MRARSIFGIGLGASVALLAGVATAQAACLQGEDALQCASRIAQANCARSRVKALCLVKEAAKVTPQVVAWLAQKASAAISGAAGAVRETIAQGIAHVMGNTQKISDPRWTGQFCSQDAYFSRFTFDQNNDGLANVGVVEPGVLYRGSQPFTDGARDAQGRRGNGFDTLAKMGVKCRILLRTTSYTDQMMSEKRELAKRGITNYFHLPIPSWEFGPPADKILGWKIPDSVRTLYTRAMTKARDDFMRIVTSHQYGPCYLSCQSGKDRTGTLIGWYRAVVQGWKPDRIFREQEDCKFEPDGFFMYYRRVFCGWYTERFGADPTCAKILATP